ncbi:OadG family protein [Treponema sp.]|uniref:OadG family protein n=1 Tax=Treponema sp. TaxID=166 RepID=UPI00298E1F0D|nr:OadG family protein [Treponema sp.]MCI7397170.1 OadG family protein [Spirochaetia bacterium]
MTISEMLSQSGILTLLGMGVVFSFLIIMIFAMTGLHAVIHALGWDKEEKKDAPSAPAAAPAADNGAIIAAIAAAVHEKESN